MADELQPIIIGVGPREPREADFDPVTGRPILLEQAAFSIVTRDGEKIPVYCGKPPDPETLAEEERRLDDDARLIRRRGTDWTYNCHGLTLASRHGCLCVIPLDRWVVEGKGEDAPVTPDCTEGHISCLLRNAGYEFVRALNTKLDSVRRDDDIAEGDIVVYKDGRGKILHSSIVWEFDPPFVRVLSKLGEAGEYFHNYAYIPGDVYGSHVEFWSDRKGMKACRR